MEKGGVLAAVSLDIANAFNTLPWGAIRGAMKQFRFPPYLQRIVRAYLSGRRLAYRDQDVVPYGGNVYCGVPQGSVLGPLLWNLTYNRMLTAALPTGCSVHCYADDTLVLAGGNGWGGGKSSCRGCSDMRRARDSCRWPKSGVQEDRGRLLS